MDKKTLWESALAELQLNLSEANFKTWFKNKTTIVSWEKDLISIGCNSPYVKGWIESRYQMQIKSILEKVSGTNLNLAFTVEAQIKELTKSSKTKEHLSTTKPLFDGDNKKTLGEALSAARLNPSFNLEGFVVGKSNQLAYAVAKAITESPSKNYNPFFVYGGVGLGKTHLIQAIGQGALAKNPKLKVVYCACEEFTNELVTAIQTKTTPNFRNKYRNSDVLLIDDIQFLSGRESTQEEVFHTINVLLTAGKQVVLTCDRPPSTIKKLAERLKSRFEGGIIADIGQPETELREAILVQKCKNQNITLPNEIIRVLAEKFPHSIRDLEGGLVRLITYSKLTNQPVSLSLVKEVVKISAQQGGPRATPISVLEAAAKYFSLTPSEIKSGSRRPKVVRSRQITMYILRTDLGLTLSNVAELLNKADHTSVIYSVKKVENDMKDSEETREIIENIRDVVFT